MVKDFTLDVDFAIDGFHGGRSTGPALRRRGGLRCGGGVYVKGQVSRAAWSTVIVNGFRSGRRRGARSPSDYRRAGQFTSTIQRKTLYAEMPPRSPCRACQDNGRFPVAAFYRAKAGAFGGEPAEDRDTEPAAPAR